MIKWITIVLAAVFFTVFLGLYTFSYLYGKALRNAGILEGRIALKMAADDYAEHGYVTNYGARTYQVWLSTNVVRIGETQYQCFITTTNAKFYGEGSLAVTTNQVFIWVDKERPPKIIPIHYRAPIFSSHF